MPYKKFVVKEWMERLRDEDICREYPAAVIDGSYVDTLGDRFEASVVVQRAEILTQLMKQARYTEQKLHGLRIKGPGEDEKNCVPYKTPKVREKNNDKTKTDDESIK